VRPPEPYLAAVHAGLRPPILPGSQGAGLCSSTAQQPGERIFAREERAEGIPEPRALLLGLLGTGRGGGGGGGARANDGGSSGEEVLALVGVDVEREEVVRLLVFPRQLPLVVGGGDAPLGVTANAPLEDKEDVDTKYLLKAEKKTV